MKEDGIVTDMTAQEKLETIKKEYAKNLPNKVAEIQTLWQTLKNEPNKTNIDALHIKAHSLAGSAGIHGFDAISKTAKELELTVEKITGKVDDASLKKIEKLLPGLENYTVTEKPATEFKPSVSSAPESQTKKVFLLVNQEEAKKYTGEIKLYGYDPEVFTSLFNFTKHLTDHEADILIIDVDFIIDFNHNEMQEFLEYLKTTPVVFISRSGEFSFRLRAVKANGQAFFIKTFNFADLVDELERVLSTKQDKLRILIIDDDNEVANYYSELLSGYNMETKVINEAKVIDQALHEFHPDLILTDFHMPECDGRELAAIIRQQRAFEGVPIIFLSAEEDRLKQLNALHSGADDFVTKSTKPEHLYLTITNRANRYKQLRKLVTNDNLTGVLSYAAITKQYNDKFAELAKGNTPFSAALLRIDNFKQLTTTYGYAAGDQVINMLAHILRNKLRLRDLVGRYGAAEFLIVLPETDQATAKKIVDEASAQFKALSFWWDYRMFTSTFSASLGTYPQFTTATKLLDAVKASMEKGTRGTVIMAANLETSHV